VHVAGRVPISSRLEGVLMVCGTGIVPESGRR